MITDEGLELLEEKECFELLAQGLVGRVALSMRALPVVFPVNYVLDNSTIVFRTGPGLKLAAASDGVVVAFEVDDWDAPTRTGWSVLAIGVGSLLVDPAEIQRASSLGLSTWAEGDRQALVKIPVEMISGRRIVHQVGDETR